MNLLFNKDAWARKNFGDADFGDKRITDRLVETASAMAAHPEKSLPQQMESFAAAKAAYRFLSNSRVNLDRIQEPHRKMVIQQAAEAEVPMLFIQDTSELDYSNLKATEGVGPIGNHRGDGLIMHSCLAVKYHKSNPEVIGVAAQKSWARPYKPSARKQKESTLERRRKKRESEVWIDTLKNLGRPPVESTFVSISDRGSDIYEYMAQAISQGWHFVVRAKSDRRLTPESQSLNLRNMMESAPIKGQYQFSMRKSGQTKPEIITVSLTWENVELRRPSYLEIQGDALRVSAIRCWNKEKGIDWILYSSMPVHNLEEAYEKIDWYVCRWIIEEYHKCLKTGCSMEDTQLTRTYSIKALLGVVGILATLMLQLRNLSRDEVDGARPAKDIVPVIPLKLICVRYCFDKETITTRDFMRSVARLGGFLGRKSDGDPGWQSLWAGWLRLMDMWLGAEIYEMALDIAR